MSNNWATITISDLVAKGEAEIKTGPFGTQLHASDYVEEGTPVLNAGNVGFGDIRTDKLDFISAETVNRLSSHLLQPEDIIFGRKGTVERHAFIRDRHTNWFQGTDCLRLRLKSPSIEPRFVSYYFLTNYHKQWIMNQSSHGATMTSLNQAIIGRITFNLPPLLLQRKIIDILSAYDDLIENNTRRIRILEQMARVIYHEWFGNIKTGSLPKGWETKTISDLCDFISRGVTPKYAEGSRRYVINQKANRGTFIDVKNLKELDPKLYVPEDKFARAEDVLINSLGEGTLGRVHYFLGPTKLWAVDQHMTICRSSIPGAALLIYFYLSSDEGQARIESLKTGGTNMTMFNISEVRQFELIAPPENLLKKFYELINPLWQMKRTLELKNTNLRQTRDLLLPRLVSGEIDVEGKND